MDERKKPTGRPMIYDGSQMGRMSRQRQNISETKEQENLKKEQTEREQSVRSTAGQNKVKVIHSAKTAENPSSDIKRPVRESVAPKQGKRRREQENESKMQTLTLILGVLIVLLLAAIFYEIILGHGTKLTGGERMAVEKQQKQDLQADKIAKENGEDQGENAAEEDNAGNQENNMQMDETDQTADQDTDESSTEAAVSDKELTSQAEFMAQQYDYDGAIDLLKKAQGYGENSQYQEAVTRYEQAKAACVPYPAEEVTHVFFHTLIHDPVKAFDGDEYEDGYNQFMVTEGEFNSIIQQMYDRGYVMVFLSDFTEQVDDGNGNLIYQPKDVMLPEGKIPFVLSQDDVSYYHYMDGDGYALRLIVDENGDVKNEYIEDDGSISVGDYDMVPLIDRFVEKHPDFSYRGAKGYVALTGYEGVLGYRTDEVYKTKEAERVTIQQQMFFDAYPGGFDEAAFEKECAEAKKVAEAMKANGWKFASHTWGHQNLHETNGISWEKFVRDTDRWENWVEPIVGETDTIIYAFGGDIQGWEPYSGDRFNYLKEAGFDYYCGVDSSKYWVQIGDNYVRQSRRNIDGYRMYYNPDMLSDLFDVSAAWDPARPASVPQI